MRRPIPGVILTLLLGLLLFTACDDDSVTKVRNTDFFAEEPFSFALERETQTGLRLEGINGRIEVTGIPGADSIAVTGVRRVESESTEDAEEHLAQLEVEVARSGTNVLVRTIQPEDSAGRTYIVDYVISVPEDFGIDIATINGDVTVGSIKNNTSVHCVNGRIRADAIEGSAEMDLTNGQIDVSMRLPPTGQIYMRVTNGTIDLDIPADTSAEFRATVVNGDITTMNLSISHQTQGPGYLTGRLGDGQGGIRLDVVNGTIAVRGVSP
jgi:DUF4097 and DUF4098 domain-containing protein YvlB